MPHLIFLLILHGPFTLDIKIFCWYMWDSLAQVGSFIWPSKISVLTSYMFILVLFLVDLAKCIAFCSIMIIYTSLRFFTYYYWMFKIIFSTFCFHRDTQGSNVQALFVNHHCRKFQVLLLPCPMQVYGLLGLCFTKFCSFTVPQGCNCSSIRSSLCCCKKDAGVAS